MVFARQLIQFMAYILAVKGSPLRQRQVALCRVPTLGISAAVYEKFVSYGKYIPVLHMNPYTAEHQTHTNQQKSDYINILNPLYISNC